MNHAVSAPRARIGEPTEVSRLSWRARVPGPTPQPLPSFLGVRGLEAPLSARSLRGCVSVPHRMTNSCPRGEGGPETPMPSSGVKWGPGPFSPGCMCLGRGSGRGALPVCLGSVLWTSSSNHSAAVPSGISHVLICCLCLASAPPS